jgi:topoisomerase-4 subunit A
MQFTEDAYRNYATYVILDRAIPRLEDGLKPVQRRILYAMSELGLKSTSKPKKSARTVGDVLGKFHPHGDSACYEAMVLMAQSFSYRYPLIQGQGNWGAIDDPKSFAAMRYTEANLSPYAQVLLKSLGPHTTDWGPNFDGSLKEPLILPTGLPNILLNGASGIAVGLATDIPPHNIIEVGNACIALLRNPELTLDELMQVLPGPDYPTGAEIINTPAELRSIAHTGQGSIKQRATFVAVSDQLTITELPFQLSTSKVIQQIADLMIAKKLPQVRNLRDESDESAPIAIVLSLRSNRVNTDELMQMLFAETDLEKNHKVNITYISPERKPVQTGVLPLLKSWLVFFEKSIIKQLSHKLNVAEKRLHILEGLLLIFANIDEVIRIIRHEDSPKPVLIARFSLSEEQATAILETKLKHLARLEEDLLKKEHLGLLEEANALKSLLEDDKKRTLYMVQHIRDCLGQHGDERRTQLIARKGAMKVTLSRPIHKEPVTIILSKNNWIRSAKGHDIDPALATFKTGDSLATFKRGFSHWPTVLLDITGVAYTLPTHALPSARSPEPVSAMVKPGSAIFPLMINAHPETSVLLSSQKGYGFVAQFEALVSRNKAGKKVLNLGNSHIADVLTLSADTESIALVSQQGRLLIISLADIPTLSKGKGNKLIQIHSKDIEANTDSLVYIKALSQDAALILHSGKRFFRLSPKDQSAYLGARGQRGVLLPRGYRRVTDIATEGP